MSKQTSKDKSLIISNNPPVTFFPPNKLDVILDPIIVSPITGREKAGKGVYRCATINVEPESIWL